MYYMKTKPCLKIFKDFPSTIASIVALLFDRSKTLCQFYYFVSSVSPSSFFACRKSAHLRQEDDAVNLVFIHSREDTGEKIPR